MIEREKETRKIIHVTERRSPVRIERRACLDGSIEKKPFLSSCAGNVFVVLRQAAGAVAVFDRDHRDRANGYIDDVRAGSEC